MQFHTVDWLGFLRFVDITTSEYREAFEELSAARESYLVAQHDPDAIQPASEHFTRSGLILFLRFHTLYFLSQRLFDNVVAAADAGLSPLEISRVVSRSLDVTDP